MLPFKTILFDFDGTIADTLSACIQVANNNSELYGYRRVEAEEVESLRSLTPFQLLKKFQVPFYKVPFLIKKLQLELYNDMDKIKIFPGMKNMLKKLATSHQLGIITSNTEANVRKCLAFNTIDCFDFIHNERNILGKSQTIKNTISEQRLLKSEVVYVGDEVRDIEASRKSKIRCISVTWGFNTKELLASHKPDYMVDTPGDLLTLLTK